MYQQSPILGALALAAFIICAVATGVIVILWLVERYWIPKSMLDESWLYGEDVNKPLRPRVRSMRAEIEAIRPEDIAR